MGVILALGEKDVARVNLYRYDQGTPSAHGLVRTLTVSGGHSIPEQIPGHFTYPVDDDHQARIS